MAAPALPRPPTWGALLPKDDAARAIGRANGRDDTRQELRVRSALHRAGLRFRIRFDGGYTKADVAFTRARLAVFLDGCFWHGCPEHLHLPKHNRPYWEQKLAVNRARDARNTAALQAEGWSVLRFWEHEAPEDVCAVVLATLGG